MLNKLWRFINQTIAAPIALAVGANPLFIIGALAIVLIILVFIISGALFGNCGEKRLERKLDNINAQISNANIGAEIINAQKQNANAVTRNAEAETNAAKANLEKARNANFNGINGRDLDKLGESYK